MPGHKIVKFLNLLKGYPQNKGRMKFVFLGRIQKLLVNMKVAI